MLVIKVTTRKTRKSREECEKKTKQIDMIIYYGLCNINDQVTWGEKFWGKCQFHKLKCANKKKFLKFEYLQHANHLNSKNHYKKKD
jgi:hypothetical protein